MQNYMNYNYLMMEATKNAPVFNPYQILLDNAQEKPVYICSPEKQKNKKRCINNSFEALLEKNISNYVEGIMFWYVPIAHAWNQDVNGAWIDFTLSENEDAMYYGMVIPKSIVVIASTLREWTMCTGVIQTMAMTRDKDAKKEVLEIFNESNYIINQ